MESLFVRSLALPATPAAHCLVSASRTTADGTFAVASASEGVIRVYAASCAALLHEFASIHRRIYALHYTSFSDSLVTLESDATAVDSGGDNDGDDDDAETFLCVYHDWRERKMVRGYTLPLGVLESPSSKRKADCVAVCSFTGRVVVAMGTVLNIWQCSRGFFEHVMELKVDMSQQHAYLQVEFVAIHGVYVAYASQTEVRVMEIHVRSAKEAESSASYKPLSLQTSQLHAPNHHPFHRHDKKDFHNEPSSRGQVPEDETDCVNISSLDALDAFVEVPIPCSSYGEMDTDQRDERRIFDDQDHVPMVLGRNEAQQEAWNLAGLVKSQDIRVNQALSYFVGESDVQVLLQRFLPPNHCVQSLKFLPETIDNQVSVEARSYTRLLVATERDAFLYYFLSQEADLTRKKMSKKVFGKGERTKSRGMHTPIKVQRKNKIVMGKSSNNESFSSLSDVSDDEEDAATAAAADIDETSESGRVVMYYKFSSPVVCIAANSSFLFVATLSGLQVWSIWSPCHYIAASRALSQSLVPQPAQPQLLCTQPIPFPPSQIAALDSYVVLLPKPTTAPASEESTRQDFIRLGSMAAADLLPEAEFEMRRSSRDLFSNSPNKLKRSVMIFQQSPPSLIFSYMRNGILSTQDGIKPSQLDLLLSLFSLYRYRADVGLNLLHMHSSISGATNDSITGDKNSSSSIVDEKEKLALELETKLYDTIAKACAADLANIFTSASHRNLSRAALLFVASNVPSSDVMQRFQAIMDDANRSEVIDATGKYLDAFVFPSSESLPSIGMSQAAAYSTRQSNESNFTRTVLLHYGKYAPEQLSRLIVDSTLVWSLQDIEFGLEKLTESTSQSVLVKIATLVLILRASSTSFEAWEAFKVTQEDEKSVDHFLSVCSYESMASHVKHLLSDHLDALVHLSVTHPELLVQVAELSTTTADMSKHFTSSSFAHALLEQAPTVLVQILERVFTSAVRRQEAVFASLLFCLSVIGEAAEPSIQRLTFSRSANSTGAAASITTSATTTMPFVANQCFVLRFLVFALEMFPTLEQLVEKEELHEDEDDLKRMKAAVGMEMMALCVKLSSFVSSLNKRSSGDQDEDGKVRVQSTLLKLFDKRGTDGVRDEFGAQLPDWVHEYLETRCLPSEGSSTSLERLRSRLRFLFTLTLELQQEEDLVSPSAILRVYDTTPLPTTANKKRNKNAPSPSEPSSATKWRLENDFAALIVLLTLPRLSRYAPKLPCCCRKELLTLLYFSCAERWTVCS